MAVELGGNVRMRGDNGPGVEVTLLAAGGRLRLVSGNELIGDWVVSDLGINSLQEGFNIKAEGEEFVLRTEDDVAFAEELGVTAVSHRLARRLAVRNNPAEPEAPVEAPQVTPGLAAIGLALSGTLIVVGGALASWPRFITGGVLMAAVALAMVFGAKAARAGAFIVLLVLIVMFAVTASGIDPTTSEITAVAFIAGGIVVAVAVMASGSLREPE